MFFFTWFSFTWFSFTWFSFTWFSFTWFSFTLLSLLNVCQLDYRVRDGKRTATTTNTTGCRGRTMSTSSWHWHILPNEMKLAIIAQRFEDGVVDICSEVENSFNLRHGLSEAMTLITNSSRSIFRLQGRIHRGTATLETCRALVSFFFHF
jgi:hypothetical protein